MDSLKNYKVADLSSEACDTVSKFESQLKQEVGQDVILIAYEKDIKDN